MYEFRVQGLGIGFRVLGVELRLRVARLGSGGSCRVISQSSLRLA